MSGTALPGARWPLRLLALQHAWSSLGLTRGPGVRAPGDRREEKGTSGRRRKRGRRGVGCCAARPVVDGGGQGEREGAHEPAQPRPSTRPRPRPCPSALPPYLSRTSPLLSIDVSSSTMGAAFSKALGSSPLPSGADRPASARSSQHLRRARKRPELTSPFAPSRPVPIPLARPQARSLATRRCGFSCSAWMRRARRVRLRPWAFARGRPVKQSELTACLPALPFPLAALGSHPVQAQAQPAGDDDPDSRLQRRDGHVQERQGASRPRSCAARRPPVAPTSQLWGRRPRCACARARCPLAREPRPLICLPELCWARAALQAGRSELEGGRGGRMGRLIRAGLGACAQGLLARRRPPARPSPSPPGPRTDARLHLALAAVQRLGCRRPGQDPAALAPLLHGHAGAALPCPLLLARAPLTRVLRPTARTDTTSPLLLPLALA